MSFFGNVLKARQEKAARDVHAYLAQFDDAQLNRLGYDRKQLKSGGSVNYFL